MSSRAPDSILEKAPQQRSQGDTAGSRFCHDHGSASPIRLTSNEEGLVYSVRLDAFR